MSLMRSYLLNRTWELPGIGDVRMRAPSTDDLVAIDAAWPALRQDEDWHHAWRWSAICEGKRECFAITLGSENVGIWCCDRTSLLRLPGLKAYRLDYIEVHPDMRGGPMGPFALTVVASRALELGADAIVLAAFPIPGLVEAYEKTGAVRRCPKGWNPASKLVPLMYEQVALVQLKGHADELLKQS